jgi:hypothetical protein
MVMTIDRTDICYIELISMIETVGFHGAFDYLYYRVKNAHGKAQFVPIEHASEVETMVSLLNKEKNINLYVFKEKPNVDIVTPGSQSTDESVCTRKKPGYTVSGYAFIPNLHRTSPSVQTLINIYPVTF